MLTRKEKESLLEVLETKKNVACLTHLETDADTLGSALSWQIFLENRGIKTHVIVPDPKPHKLIYLPNYKNIYIKEPDLETLDALFVFDCGDAGRTGNKQHYLDNKLYTVNIDHHTNNPNFGDLNIVRSNASSTGEMLYEIYQELRVTIFSEMATHLYAAIFTDTMGFRSDTTTPRTIEIAADLAKLGAQIHSVHRGAYGSKSFEALTFQNSILSKVSHDQSKQIFWCTITEEDFLQFGIGLEDTMDIIDILLTLEEAQIVIVFKELGNCIKVSMRTKNNINAAKICSVIGGGGHPHAGGATTTKGLAETKHLIVQEAKRFLPLQD